MLASISFARRGRQMPLFTAGNAQTAEPLRPRRPQSVGDDPRSQMAGVRIRWPKPLSGETWMVPSAAGRPDRLRPNLSWRGVLVHSPWRQADGATPLRPRNADRMTRARRATDHQEGKNLGALANSGVCVDGPPWRSARSARPGVAPRRCRPACTSGIRWCSRAVLAGSLATSGEMLAARSLAVSRRALDADGPCPSSRRLDSLIPPAGHGGLGVGAEVCSIKP